MFYKSWGEVLNNNYMSHLNILTLILGNNINTTLCVNEITFAKINHQVLSFFVFKTVITINKDCWKTTVEKEREIFAKLD